jgi:hypothetical protein
MTSGPSGWRPSVPLNECKELKVPALSILKTVAPNGNPDP